MRELPDWTGSEADTRGECPKGWAAMSVSVGCDSTRGRRAARRNAPSRYPCYLWYLLLRPDGSHHVVRAWPEWKDVESSDAESLEDVTTPRDLEICAPTFEEFIKRFWIENTIWFAVNKGEVLDGELRAYAQAAKAAAARA